MRFKSALCIVIVCCMSQPAFSQIKKGQVSLGLNLNFQAFNNKQSNFTTTNTLFLMGTLLTSESFLKDNFSIIGGLGWTYSKQHYVENQTNSAGNAFTNDQQSIMNQYSPTIGIRRYWFMENGRLGVFLSPIVSVNYQLRKRIDVSTNPALPIDQRKSETKKEIWSSNLNGDVGLCYFIIPHLTLEVSSTFFQVQVIKKFQSVSLNPKLGDLSYGVRYYF